MSDFLARAQTAQESPDQADFAALRRDYVESAVYRPLKHIPQTKLMQITDNAADFHEVIQTCRSLIDAVPLDLEAWRVLALAYEQVGDTDNATRAHRFTEGLLDSILATGNGKSLETAFHLVAENEAWTVMRVFGIRAKGQERLRQDGRVYDIFEGALDDRTVKIYFDVTDPVRVLDQTVDDSLSGN